MILVYKLATTGLPLFREPDDDPHQPHIVALSAMLCRQDGELEDELHRIDLQSMSHETADQRKH